MQQSYVSSIIGQYGNRDELDIAATKFDVVVCAEKKVSGRRHVSKFLLPGFEAPNLLLRGAVLRSSQRRRLFVVAGPDPQVGQMASPQPEGDLRDHISLILPNLIHSFHLTFSPRWCPRPVQRHPPSDPIPPPSLPRPPLLLLLDFQPRQGICPLRGTRPGNNAPGASPG